MVKKESVQRNLSIVEAVFDGKSRGAWTQRCRRDSRRNTLHFHRFRSRRGLIQPTAPVPPLRLTFKIAEPGPMAFGFGCHYGLGLFRAADPS